MLIGSVQLTAAMKATFASAALTFATVPEADQTPVAAL
jgi:hypothetical protein